MSKLPDKILDRFIRNSMRDTEQIRKLMDNPAWKAATQFQEHWRLVTDSPAFRAMQQMEKTRFLDSTNTPALEALRKMESQHGYKELIRASQALRTLQTFSNFHDPFSAFKNLPALSAILNEAVKFSNSGVIRKDFPHSFAGQILDFLHDASDEPDEDPEQIATRLEHLFTEKLKELSPSILSYEGLLQILMAVILFWYQSVESSKSENRISDLMLRSEDRIVKQIETLKPGDGNVITYVVLDRPAPLKIEPTSKSPLIDVLYPNQRVSVLKKQGDWLYVEYFDFIEGIPKAGWVLQKYLNQIEEVDSTEPALLKRITTDPQQCGGRPCIRGMRIRVEDVLDLFSVGLTAEQILGEMPDLEINDLKAALLYDARRQDRPTLSA